MDFCDDAHLEAAVAKNKQTFLGKKLTIVRSDPKGKRKVSFGDDRNSTKQGHSLLQTKIPKCPPHFYLK